MWLLYRVTLVVEYQGWDDNCHFDYSCQAVSARRNLGRIGWIAVQDPNQCQLNPGTRPPESPCSIFHAFFRRQSHFPSNQFKIKWPSEKPVRSVPIPDSRRRCECRCRTWSAPGSTARSRKARGTRRCTRTRRL